jgi:hypothetical protein
MDPYKKKQKQIQTMITIFLRNTYGKTGKDQIRNNILKELSAKNVLRTREMITLAWTSKNNRKNRDTEKGIRIKI